MDEHKQRYFPLLAWAGAAVALGGASAGVEHAWRRTRLGGAEVLLGAGWTGLASFVALVSGLLQGIYAAARLERPEIRWSLGFEFLVDALPSLYDPWAREWPEFMPWIHGDGRAAASVAILALLSALVAGFRLVAATRLRDRPLARWSTTHLALPLLAAVGLLGATGLAGGELMSTACLALLAGSALSLVASLADLPLRRTSADPRSSWRPRAWSAGGLVAAVALVSAPGWAMSSSRDRSLDLLEHGSPEESFQALLQVTDAHELDAGERRQVDQALLRALREEDPGSRVWAIQLLKSQLLRSNESAACVPPELAAARDSTLLALLVDPDPFVAYAAWDYAVVFMRSSPPAEAQLLLALDRLEPSVRVGALNYLARSEQRRRPWLACHLPRALALLFDPEPRVAEMAVRAVERLSEDPRWVPELHQLLAAPTTPPTVRAAVVRCLRRGAESAVRAHQPRPSPPRDVKIVASGSGDLSRL